MNTTPVTDTHEKARAENTGGFIEYIADFDNTTLGQRAQDGDLSQLDSLHDDLGLPTNHIDNTRYLDNDLSMRGGNSKGDKLPNTVGSYGLVMLNNKGELVNVAAHMPNSDKPPNISDTTQASAYAIGSMSLNDDWWLVTGLSDAVTLYAALAMMNGNENVTVFACLNQSLYDKTLRHFAEVKTINIIDTAQHKDRIISRLAGVNAIAHIAPIDSIINRLNESDLIGDLIADAETIDLAALTWGTLGCIANTDSKPTRYPVEAWGTKGGMLRDAVEATAYYAQTPVAMAGQCFLGVMSTIGQRYVNAPFVIGNKYMPSSLFVLTQAESGGGKSRTMGFTHHALREFQTKKRKEHKTLIGEWKSEKVSVNKKDLERWLLENPPPKRVLIYASSGTIQGFLDNMLLGNTRDIAWSTAEAAMFLNGHSMTSETAKNNMSTLTDIWSEGNFDRVLSPRGADNIEEIGADGVRFTLDLQGQPPIIEPALNNEVMNEQGLLPRFLFAFPASMNGQIVYNTPEYMDAQPDRDARLVIYWRRCNELLDPSQSKAPIDDEGNPKRLNMPFADRQAKQALADYQTLVESKTANGGEYEHYGPYARRQAENTSRIATLIALFEDRKSLQADDFKRAAMLAKYSITERIRYTDSPQTGDNDSQKLIRWLVSYCKKQSVNQIAYSTAQSKVNPKPLRNKAVFELCTSVLASEHYIKIIPEGNKRTIQIRPDLLA